MKAYVINESLTQSMIEDIERALNDPATLVGGWPTKNSSLPADIDVAILIVEESNTQLEEQRAIAAVSAGVRIICIFLSEIEHISDIAKKYCSTKVTIGSDALTGSFGGNDSVQEQSSGERAPQNPQKPHGC